MNTFQFHYRETPFGTSFQKPPLKDGSNTIREPGDKEDPHLLYCNEIATDVGGCFMGYDQCELPIFDHHFARKHAHPSAAAAILHGAKALKEKVQTVASETGCTDFWLVTHRETDFDAEASRFLARSIIVGDLSADGWEQSPYYLDPLECPEGKGINWEEPNMMQLNTVMEGDSNFPIARRTAILIAAIASKIDQCRTLSLPFYETVNAVFHSAKIRGRPSFIGALPLFNYLIHAIQQDGFNPIYDPMKSESEFSAELQLLEHEPERYARDLARARKVKVNVPFTDEPFEKWFPRVKEQPLMVDRKGQPLMVDRKEQPLMVDQKEQLLRVDPFLNDVHVKDASSSKSRQVDGIFIRDPESLLFKEMVRADKQNSPSGEGFSFTMVARSQCAPNSTTPNKSRYWIALDPEQANGMHLYPLWAHIQYNEYSKRKYNKDYDYLNWESRRGYEGRHLGTTDPWYDGETYKATILDTPTQGTAFQEGNRSDLMDDDLGKWVFGYLTDSLFKKWPTSQKTEDSEDQVDILAGDFPLSTLKANANTVLKPITIDLESLFQQTSTEISKLENNLVRLSELEDKKLPVRAFRLALIPLNPDTNLNEPGMLAQIGKRIWPILETPNVSTFPTDFEHRHLHLLAGGVAVWNRCGIALAFKWDNEGQALADNYFAKIKELSEISQQINKLLSQNEDTNVTRKNCHNKESGEILTQLAEFRQTLQSRDFRPLAKLFATCDYEKDVSVIHAIIQQRTDERERQFEIRINQLALLFAIPALTFALISATFDMNALFRDFVYNSAPWQPKLQSWLTLVKDFYASDPILTILLTLIPFIFVFAFITGCFFIKTLIRRIRNKKEGRKDPL